MLLTWYGHSCFKLEAKEGSLILDPYADGFVPGLRHLAAEADAVTCSHAHNDHNARQNVTLTGRPCGLAVRPLECFHDDRGGSLRGKNRIHIVTGDGLTVTHLGDLGHVPSEEQLKALEGLDALLLPVGGYYTIDAKTADAIARRLHPRVVVPMHYRVGNVGLPAITELGDFLRLRSDAVFYDGNRLTLTKDTPPQTAVLTCHNV